MDGDFTIAILEEFVIFIKIRRNILNIVELI
jgi:hypothetical protein